MIVALLHQAIARWQDKNGGRKPSLVKVQPFVMRALETDLDSYAKRHDPKLIGGFKIADIEIVETTNVFFAEIVP